MRYFIKINEIREKLDFMEKKVDIINENIEKLELICRELNWQGDAANDFYFNYEKYVLRLKQTEHKIVNSILFLTSFYDSYGDEYARIKRKYSSIIDEEL